MHGKSTIFSSEMFFEKVLKVKDVAVLTFADLVQRLLADYIRDVLLQLQAASGQSVSTLLC